MCGVFDVFNTEGLNFQALGNISSVFNHRRPDTIFSILKEILTMHLTQLIKKAYQSRAFVKKWHHPISISKRIEADLEAALDLKT